MRWVKGQSGNYSGRPAKGRSMSDILEHKLGQAGKEQICQRIIDLAMGTDDTPPLVSMGACRTILNFVDGLPVRKPETKSELRVVVEYVDEGRHPDTIDLKPARQIEAGNDDD